MKYYVYSLWLNDKCFYVGCATDPVERLSLHWSCPSKRMRIFIKGISKDSVSIKIIATFYGKSGKSSALKSEADWIKTLYNLGHPLLNEKHVPVRSHFVSIDYLDQALKRLVNQGRVSAAQHKLILSKFNEEAVYLK
jgi:hypothetical protein